MSPDLPTAWRALAFDEIDSTNAEAMRRAAVGERGPAWITARFQSKGRGRSGRTWASADASLAATLLIAPTCPPASLPQLSLVAGIAAHDAIVGMLPVAARRDVRIKWPNDILIRGDKVAGILVESTIIGRTPVAAIGTGINVAAAPDLAQRQAASVAMHGGPADVSLMSSRLAASLELWIGTWAAGAAFATIRAAWLDRAGPLGEPMTVNAAGVLVAGRFAGLDLDGALLLDTGGTEPCHFTFGDVALAPPRV